jgi:hypothetical protein
MIYDFIKIFSLDFSRILWAEYNHNLLIIKELNCLSSYNIFFLSLP